MFPRTMIYHAIRIPTGEVVVLHPDYMAATTKIVDNEDDYMLELRRGWSKTPQEAYNAREREEQAIGQAAAERVFTDRHMSEAAKKEADAADDKTSKHLPEIPETPKRAPSHSPTHPPTRKR